MAVFLAEEALVVMSAVNWTKVLSKCTPAVRKTLLHARATHEELSRQLIEQASLTPKLDFGVYRSAGVAAGVVAEAEGKVKGFSVAKRDLSAELKALDAERDQKMAESKKFLEGLEVKVKALKEQLQKLENAKPVDELTVKDVYEVHPEYQERVHDAIRQDNWGVAVEAKAGKADKTEANQTSDSQQSQLNYL